MIFPIGYDSAEYFRSFLVQIFGTLQVHCKSEFIVSDCAAPREFSKSAIFVFVLLESFHEVNT